jgi:DNA-directed RNA polymerase specialized sigma54-like protein
MDVEQRQTLSASQRQEQVMTHHQIQALELLSQPVLELQTAIDSELERNPVLETDFDEPAAEDIRGDDDEWLEKVLKLDEESRYIKGRVSTRISEEEESAARTTRLHHEETPSAVLLEQVRSSTRRQAFSRLRKSSSPPRRRRLPQESSADLAMAPERWPHRKGIETSRS